MFFQGNESHLLWQHHLRAAGNENRAQDELKSKITGLEERLWQENFVPFLQHDGVMSKKCNVFDSAVNQEIDIYKAFTNDS